MTLKRFLYIQYQIYRFMFGKNKLYHGTLTKDTFKVWLEHTQWLFREHELNTMYYAYNLNEKGTSHDEYAGTKELLDLKKVMEKALCKYYGNPDLAYDILTKDKFVANSFFLANQIPCIPHLGVIGRGVFIDAQNMTHPIINIFQKYNDLILKNLTLEAGDGVLCCRKENNTILANDKPYTIDEFLTKLSHGIWLVQPRITSHEQIRKINSSALNTTRIVTILDRDEPVYLAGFQAFATNNQSTDSWTHGSIYVGIDVEKGCLKKDGYFNLSRNGRSLVTEHPDSKIIFENYPLPNIREAVELCIKAHRLLFFNFMVGWDIAITDEGLFVVEANEKPGMSVTQCTDGGLRKKIHEYAKRTMDYLNR